MMVAIKLDCTKILEKQTLSVDGKTLFFFIFIAIEMTK